jgi:hypothetical protein
MFETEREKYIWLAAWIDTEGNICLRPRATLIHRQGHTWDAWMLVTNTNRAVLDRVQQVAGGSIHIENRDCNRWKDRHILHIPPGRCRIILPLVRPFLLVKERQADLLLEALVLLRQNQVWASKARYKATVAHALVENDTRLMTIHAQLTELNRRGAP